MSWKVKVPVFKLSRRMTPRFCGKSQVVVRLARVCICRSRAARAFPGARIPCHERSDMRPRRARVGSLELPWCCWSVCKRVPPLDACAASAASLLNRLRTRATLASRSSVMVRSAALAAHASSG